MTDLDPHRTVVEIERLTRVLNATLGVQVVAGVYVATIAAPCLLRPLTVEAETFLDALAAAIAAVHRERSRMAGAS